MAYYFAVETEKNSYVAKNIKNSKHFGNESNSKEPYACTMGEIDEFTTEFKDEFSLKECMLKEGIIEEKNMTQELSIFYLRDIERRLVSKTILYSDSKEMIYNPNRIVEYIKEKAKENDFTFFRQLESTMPENTITKSLVAKVATLVESIAKGYNVQEAENTNIIGETARLLIYKIKTNKNGTVTCNNQIHEESLHNIIAFISDYEKTLNKRNSHTRKLV